MRVLPVSFPPCRVQEPYCGAPGDLPGYFNSKVQRNYGAVTGACLMTRAEVFRALGAFTTAFPLNHNNIGYCLKVLGAVKRVVYTPCGQLYHHELATKIGMFPHTKWRSLTAPGGTSAATTPTASRWRRWRHWSRSVTTALLRPNWLGRCRHG